MWWALIYILGTYGLKYENRLNSISFSQNVSNKPSFSPSHWAKSKSINIFAKKGHMGSWVLTSLYEHLYSEIWNWVYLLFDCSKLIKWGVILVFSLNTIRLNVKTYLIKQPFGYWTLISILGTYDTKYGSRPNSFFIVLNLSNKR